MHGEGQIPLARAEVGHPQALLARQGRIGQGVVENLDELVDLLPLARHRRDQCALAIRYAKVTQKRSGNVQVALVLAVMPVAANGFPGRLGAMTLQHGLALLAEGQLQLTLCIEQVSVAKMFWQQLGDALQSIIERQVAGDIAGLVTVDQGQVRLTLDQQGLGDDALQGRVGAHRPRQDQLDHSVALQAGAKQVEKLDARIRWSRKGRHGQTVPPIAGAVFYTPAQSARVALVEDYQRLGQTPARKRAWRLLAKEKAARLDALDHALQGLPLANLAG